MSKKTPGPLQDTRSSKNSCNKLSTITKLNDKEPEEDTAKYCKKKKKKITQYPYRACPPAKELTAN
jgi:hypothetical protein